MAFSYGGLLTGLNSGLAKRADKQREITIQDEQRERQKAGDIFSQYAQNRRMAQDEIQQAQNANLQEQQIKAMSGYRSQQQELAERALGQKMSIAEMMEQGRTSRVGMQQEGATGRTEMQQSGAGDRNAATIAGANDRNHENAVTRIYIEGLPQRGKGGVGADGQERDDKVPTDSESKDALYYSHIKRGNATMARVADKIDPRKITAYLNPSFGGSLVKPVLTPEEQVFIQGVKDYTAGVNRKESGANVRPDEMVEMLKRHIDMGLDAPEMREAKRMAREETEDMLGKMSARARRYYETHADPNKPKGWKAVPGLEK